MNAEQIANGGAALVLLGLSWAAVSFTFDLGSRITLGGLVAASLGVVIIAAFDHEVSEA